MSELPKALPKAVIRALRGGEGTPTAADPRTAKSATGADSEQSSHSHPDANLLSAFVEQSLTDEERAEMMDHLSRCADCRDLVALSLPELQPAEIATPLSGRRRFFSGRLAWGAVAASFIVVGAAVLLQYQAKMPTTTAELSSYSKSAPSHSGREDGASEKNEVVPQSSIKEGASAATPSSPSTTLKEDRELARKSSDQKRNSALAAIRPKENPSAGESDRHDETSSVIALNVPPSYNVHQAPPQPSAPAPVAESKSLSGNGPPERAKVVTPAPATASSDAAAPPKNVAGNIATAQSAPAASAQDQVSNAQPATVEVQAENPQVQAESASVSGGRLRTTLAKSQKATTFRWTLSSDGAVLRSANHGKTWQPVPLHHTAFRALTSVGADVWVGGSHGLLYHSADSGNTWQHLTPVSDGTALKDDIVALDFKNALQGKLTAASGDTWITNDGGQTWNKAE